uniref:Nudix hydrolase domain-containing protein n=1 Tax=Ananas comosus var. bracteatus TaxID=296719 RepID=A0A6V7QKA4_ANACO|nr:unnamed protein product [Ananas comosus var. bracteatus]
MASSSPAPLRGPQTLPKYPTARLALLAQHLRLYNPPPSSPSSSAAAAAEEDDAVDARGKVFSQLAVAESAAPPLPGAAAAADDADRSRPRTAAVLVCLFEDASGDLRVILTKRSSNLSTHSGEVSLPGGKTEEGDADERETAIREAKEEIGLDPALVSVVTVLEPFMSKHLLRVVPVIGLLPDKNAFKPILNTAEVEEMFDVPLEMFLKDENRRSEEREWMGVKFLVHYFDFTSEKKKFVIWGLTASILIRAASVVYQRPPSFPEQYRQFKLPSSLNANQSTS